MTIGHLYQIEGPTGKCYIGITRLTVAQRWKTHQRMAKQGRKTPLYAAIRKHGPEAFRIRELLTASWEDVNRYESETIRLRGTLAPAGYNLLSGGQQPSAHPESVARQAEKLRQLWETPAFREKMAKRARGPGMTGKRHSQETRDRISKNRRGKAISAEGERKHAETLRRRWQDPAFRAMMIAARWRKS